MKHTSGLRTIPVYRIRLPSRTSKGAGTYNLLVPGLFLRLTTTFLVILRQMFNLIETLVASILGTGLYRPCFPFFGQRRVTFSSINFPNFPKHHLCLWFFYIGNNVYCNLDQQWMKFSFFLDSMMTEDKSVIILLFMLSKRVIQSLLINIRN